MLYILKSVNAHNMGDMQWFSQLVGDLVCFGCMGEMFEMKDGTVTLSIGA